MALLEPTEHIVKMTVCNAELELDLILEDIYGHRLRRSFEFLEEFIEIGVMPNFVTVV